MVGPTSVLQDLGSDSDFSPQGPSKWMPSPLVIFLNHHGSKVLDILPEDRTLFVIWKLSLKTHVLGNCFVTKLYPQPLPDSFSWVLLPAL